MIGISDFDCVGVELLQGLLLGVFAHPIDLFDPRAVGVLEVGDERLNFRLGFRRKIFRRVELANPETHRPEGTKPVTHTEVAAAHRRNRAFPTGLLLLLTR